MLIGLGMRIRKGIAKMSGISPSEFDKLTTGEDIAIVPRNWIADYLSYLENDANRDEPEGHDEATLSDLIWEVETFLAGN